MENNFDNGFNNNITTDNQKPMLLKVLCILTYILASLFILGCGIAAVFCLALSPDKIAEVWDQVIEKQPQLEGTDPIQFFSEIGKLCLYFTLLNIVSLVGAIMMWRVSMIGLIIYAIAEIAANFLGLGLSVGGETSGISGGTIFQILLDVVFIVLYFIAIKQANKNKPLTN